MKKHIALVTGLSVFCMASPWNLLAANAGKTGNLDEFLARHPKAKERIMAKFDTNHNGVLDPDEKEAFKAAREEHREKMLAKFDTNGDGKLEPNEKAAAKKHLKKCGKKHQGQDQTSTSSSTQVQ